MEDRLYRHISALMRESYVYGSKRLGAIGVHHGQPAMLALIARGEVSSQKELAERLELAPSTVNIVLSRMEKAGWVSRRRSEDDPRVSLVEITAQGRTVLEEIFALEVRMTEEAFSGLSDEERAAFLALAGRVVANMRIART